MINERMAPELLPYKQDLMSTVLTMMSNQQQYLLESHEYGDMNGDSGVLSGDFKLQLMIIETDLERLNYIVRLYIRTRLSKLNKFTIFTSMKAVKMIIYCPKRKEIIYTNISRF